MNLRIKLLLPLVVASIAIIAYAYFSVLPNYLNLVKEENKAQLSTHLKSVSDGLVPLMQDMELLSISNNLNELLKQNPHWMSIKLFNKNDNLIYQSEDNPSKSKHISVISHKQPIVYLKEKIGKLVVVLNSSSEIKTTKDFIDKTLFLLISIISLFVIFVIVLIEQMISRPIQQIATASNQIANGDFDITLPRQGNDEIGRLTRSFSSMKDSIENYQKDLKQEMKNHEKTVLALYKEKELVSYHAKHDALTGLVNRREFEKQVEDSILDAKENNNQHGLLYLDLDQFKIVNDTCGHIAGDELLKQLSGILSKMIRKGDTLARLGGDEFGVLLQSCPIDLATSIAETLRETVQDYRFLWEENIFAVGVSVGVLSIDSDCDNLQGIFSTADAACYTAKDKGRNRVHVYEMGDVEIARRHGEMQWVASLNRALAEDRFILYCQPIVSVCNPDTEPDHYEVLLRMINEDGEIIPPGAFIPAAERFNFMQQIDRWIITKLFAFLAQSPQLDNKHMGATWSINLSGVSLSDTTFHTFLEDQLKESNISTSSLCFEITETAAIADFSNATKFIAALKKLGCSFSLDDFGSGLSSFAYLKNLPVDYLKIDGVFVKDIVTDPIDYAMVKSINEIGHVMGMKTIAEFVENDEILAKLREINIDYAQGFGIHKPFPIKELLTLRSHKKWQKMG